MRRRFARLVFVLLLPVTAHATTAPSLSGRIHIDGVLDEYAADEIVLDTTSSLPEPGDDSAWGRDDDISRVALTWDHDFLYLAVEGRTFDTFLALFVSNRAGGLHTLEHAGSFRRAIALPDFPVNLIALAQPERMPEVARADDSHPFALVDRGALPAAVAGTRNGPVGFEMAVPWSMLSLANPVRLVSAITGDVGTGAGDAAPDASSMIDDDRFARAVLDRSLSVVSDADGDGLPDAGVSPRSAVSIEGGTAPASARADAELEIDVAPRAFAPDRGEQAAFSFRIGTGERVFLSAAVYATNGDRVRTLFSDQERVPQNGVLPSGPDDAWDGRDAGGGVVRGGAYIVLVEWGRARGERSERAKAAVVVVR